ncbi:hypothetical protein FLACHUCJ7_00018 [Flavobacterium chungangense]|uniref:Uncharacterized protein n=1 Tax=Flavobacterium chungangense TaxID=554283 RepID=A0A6V6YLW4_9FLAO|nr:hypothetical protein FLACHUCJ7_00018 [Flavobacterium chungangense]
MPSIALALGDVSVIVKFPVLLIVKIDAVFRKIFLATAVVDTIGSLATLSMIIGLVAVGTPLGVQLQGLLQSVFAIPFQVILSVAVATCVQTPVPVPCIANV